MVFATWLGAVAVAQDPADECQAFVMKNGAAGKTPGTVGVAVRREDR